MMKRTHHTQEFKDEAARLSQASGRSVARVAREFGISETALHNWRRRAVSEPRLPATETETPEQKITRLELGLKLVTEKRHIIKKVALLKIKWVEYAG